MNPILFSCILLAGTLNAWNMRGSPERKQQQSPDNSCDNKRGGAFNETGTSSEVCWEAMGYKRLDLSNVTAVFKPGYWEKEYPELMNFCSERGNGTFCYRPQSQMNDTCLDMAVVRCPEGILSSCRSNFICNEMMSQNITCDASVNPIFSSNYTESGRAQCQSIEDVLKLPPAQNVTTTIDAQNKTLTVGSQVFGFPFAVSTTVDCTFQCISTLPSGFPQPTQVITACFNESLPYDQWIPKSTCVGPYPPGPMTTVTETLCSSSATSSTSSESEKSGGIYSTSSTYEMSSSISPTESSSGCPIGSSVEPTSMPTSEYQSGSSIIGGGYSSVVSSSACEIESEPMTQEPTPTPSYYYY